MATTFNRSQAGSRHEAPSPRTGAGVRIAARGKFLFAGDEKLVVCGVTYGPFRPDERTGEEFDLQTVESHFSRMVANGINAVRVYTVPPRWLLDSAARHGLRVMVGLPWEQHVAFLDDRDRARAIERRVREGVRACAGHPAVLAYAVGNEIPASIVRWHGRRRIERFIQRLYRAAKAEDPDALVTYVNYPSTEYLRLPFLDFVCFNVYLEARDKFEAYLARLQNIADNRPLLLAEIGLDSRSHGEDGQAEAIAWQLRSAYEGGCAGAYVFAWTDEWHRGGLDIDDWDFGLTARDRRPKAALAAARGAFAEAPFGDRHWPRVSVVLCTYNGAETLAESLAGLVALDYPDYEVIVVSDGSTDASAAIAREHGVRLIETENRGLSSARNTGLAASTGEIVAYIDDDARPDPQWLKYLGHTFMTTGHAAVGGPNIPFPEDGPVAHCIAQAPGGPTHVLLSDTEAEHIPGCNMAFWRERLEAIGGFDTRFRVAGDDVDVCWRVQERGWTIGFSPAAFVWHHRRGSVRAYLRQQRGYGQAEALLERKWPEKYGAGGHLKWRGRLYGIGPAADRHTRRWRVYYGTWGSGLFQSLYRPAGGLLESLPLMPEWYLAIAALTVACALAPLWSPLLGAIPLLVLAAGAVLVDAGLGAARAAVAGPPRAPRETARLRTLTAALYVFQPLWRLRGRFGGGLTLWRRRGVHAGVLPRRRAVALWDERWAAPESRLHRVESRLASQGAVSRRGGDFDRWDLEVRGGLLGAARLRIAVEEHGSGKQLVRVRSWPQIAPAALVLNLATVALAVAAALWGPWMASLALGAIAVAFGARALSESGAALAGIARALAEPGAARRQVPRLAGRLRGRAPARRLAGALSASALLCFGLAASASRESIGPFAGPRSARAHAHRHVRASQRAGVLASARRDAEARRDRDGERRLVGVNVRDHDSPIERSGVHRRSAPPA